MSKILVIGDSEDIKDVALNNGKKAQRKDGKKKVAAETEDFWAEFGQRPTGSRKVEQVSDGGRNLWKSGGYKYM